MHLKPVGTDWSPVPLDRGKHIQAILRSDMLRWKGQVPDNAIWTALFSELARANDKMEDLLDRLDKFGIEYPKRFRGLAPEFTVGKFWESNPDEAYEDWEILSTLVYSDPLGDGHEADESLGDDDLEKVEIPF